MSRLLTLVPMLLRGSKMNFGQLLTADEDTKYNLRDVWIPHVVHHIPRVKRQIR